MLSYPVAYEMMYFDIPAAKLNDIVAWVLLADEMYMRHEIETKGFAVVRGFKRITEIPHKAGIVEPYYGVTSGAYRFLFSMDGSSVYLRVLHHYGETMNLQPYEVLLGTQARFESHARSSSHWFSTSLDRMIWNRKYNYSMFIDGEIYEKMLSTGWQKELASDYSYEFVPTSVGCIIRIYHLVSGQSYDLTADIEW
jgi:hypothetical protein